MSRNRSQSASRARAARRAALDVLLARAQHGALTRAEGTLLAEYVRDEISTGDRARAANAGTTRALRQARAEAANSGHKPVVVGRDHPVHDVVAAMTGPSMREAEARALVGRYYRAVRDEHTADESTPERVGKYADLLDRARAEADRLGQLARRPARRDRARAAPPRQQLAAGLLGVGPFRSVLDAIRAVLVTTDPCPHSVEAGALLDRLDATQQRVNEAQHRGDELRDYAERLEADYHRANKAVLAFRVTPGSTATASTSSRRRTPSCAGNAIGSPP